MIHFLTIIFLIFAAPVAVAVAAGIQLPASLVASLDVSDPFAEVLASTAFEDPGQARKIEEAIHRQISMQEKLHEHLEEQRKLQVAVEAHGKYLRRVLDEQQIRANK